MAGYGWCYYKGACWAAKSGTKRSIVVDGKGVPLSISVHDANKHDMN